MVKKQACTNIIEQKGLKTSIMHKKLSQHTNRSQRFPSNGLFVLSWNYKKTETIENTTSSLVFG